MCNFNSFIGRYLKSISAESSLNNNHSNKSILNTNSIIGSRSSEFIIKMKITKKSK